MLNITIIFLALIFIFNLKFESWKSPLSLFSFVWFLVILLYQLKLFNIYSIKFNTELIIFLSILFFILGYVISKLFYHPKKIIKKEINNKKIVILIFIIIALSIPFYSSQLQNLFINGFDIMKNKIDLVLNTSNSGGIIMQFIVRPFEYIIIAISSYYYFDKTKNILIRYSGFLVVILKFLATGSKAIGIFFIICLISSYCLVYMKHKDVYKNRIKIVVIIFIIFLVIIIYMGNFIEDMYFYICGCIPMLDKVINSSFYFDHNFTLGFLSFNGIFRLLINIFSIFGLTETIDLFKISESIIQLFEYTVFITPIRTYNGFTSYISNFYIDFGIIGVMILSFLFGMFSYVFYKKFIDTPCVENFVLLTLIYYFIAFSVVRFQLSNTILAMTFIYSLFFLCLKIKIKF